MDLSWLETLKKRLGAILTMVSIMLGGMIMLGTALTSHTVTLETETFEVNVTIRSPTLKIPCKEMLGKKICIPDFIIYTLDGFLLGELAAVIFMLVTLRWNKVLWISLTNLTISVILLIMLLVKIVMLHLTLSLVWSGLNGKVTVHTGHLAHGLTLSCVTTQVFTLAMHSLWLYRRQHQLYRVNEIMSR